jgi:galactokinase
MDDLIERVKRQFHELFSETPIIIISPGRVNFIGEHTDYNDGFVLPAAIDKRIVAGIAPSGTTKCTVYAIGLQEHFSFDIHQVAPGTGWQNYLLGVVHHLQAVGHTLHGFNCVVDGDIPIGSGMSSSAALEGGISLGLSEIFGLNISRFTLAKTGQLAEHTYVGVQCGIMDQFANMHGKKDQLMRLDCRSLEYHYYPFHFPEYKIVLCNTMVSHSLASSEYNVRRKQCGEGVKILQQFYPDIINLRDVSPEMLEEHKEALPPVIYKRCKYVTEENKRVICAGGLLQKGDLVAFGKLMHATHDGLSHLYEVSCPELDYLVELTAGRSEVAGARMMGGGFGGCTINIVEAAGVEDFKEYIVSNYKKKFNRVPDIYITTIEEGAHRLG